MLNHNIEGVSQNCVTIGVLQFIGDKEKWKGWSYVHLIYAFITSIVQHKVNEKKHSRFYQFGTVTLTISEKQPKELTSRDNTISELMF